MKIDFSKLMNTVVSSSMEEVTLGNYIFFDIETTPCHENMTDMSQENQDAWKAVCERRYADELKKGKSPGIIYQENAGLMPEFNRVVCISVGRFIEGEQQLSSLILPPDANNDKKIVEAFTILLHRQPGFILSGFNITGFDIPVLFKKCVKYGISVPQQLNLWNVKPWERQLIDIFDIWKFGSYTGSSLQTVSTFLGCGNPKNDVHASDVRTLYKNRELDKIELYCEGDVSSCMCIFEKFQALNIV